MKGKLLKKIVAAAATIAMAAQFAIVVPASAATGDVTTIVDAALTSTTLPTITGVTWGSDVAGLITAEKGLLLGNLNAAGNDYTDKSFVSFEAAKGSSTSKLTITYNVAYQDKSKGQAYNDYTMSYYNEDGQFLFSLTESIGNWSDKAKVTYATSATATASADLASHVGKQVTAEFSYDADGNGFLVIDGGTYNVFGGSKTGVKDIKLTVAGGQDYNRGVYIKNYKITGTEVVAKAYRTVNFNVDGKETTVVVEKGSTISAADIPAAAKLGYLFKGWSTDGTSEFDSSKSYVSNDDLQEAAVNDNASYTAVFDVDAAYIQKIAKIEFLSAEPVITAPSTGSADQELEVKVTSENGKDLSDDCTFVWTIVGNEADAEYTSLSKNSSKTNTLSVKNGMEKSYFGYISVEATYTPSNGNESDVTTATTTPLHYALLQDASSPNFIPVNGYPVSMNDYADSIVDIKATGTDITSRDVVLNNWSIYGSNGSRTLTLKKGTDGDKYLEFEANGGGGSTVGVYQWPGAASAYIIDSVLSMPSGASLGLYSNTPNNSNAVTAWAVSQTATGIKVGDSAVDDVTAGEFFRLVTVVDPVSKQYYAKAYSADGTYIGETDVAAMGDASKYLCFFGAWPVKVKSFKAYHPTLASAVIAGASTVKVPETGEPANKTSYKATVKDTEGNVIPSAVTWSLASTYNGVEINETTGELSVSNGAGGNITIVATAGAARAEFPVLLTTSSNVVTISGPSSVTIPFAGEAAVESVYSAKTIDKDGNDVAGDSITYSLLQKDGITPYTTMPNGIAFDAKKAKLTVSAGAPAGVVYVQAMNSEGLINSVKVNIHGMLFDFGTDDPDEGYTQVLATNQYSATTGFGFETLTGLTAAADNVGGSAAYTFKAKVPNGNYQVTADTTSAKMLSETVDGSSITRNAKTFNVAVCDGVLDITFDAASTVSSLQIAQLAQPKAGEKPSIYSIGDSTTKNSGHFTGYDPNSTTNDHKTYASWGNCVTSDMWNENFLSYSNNGMAGRNSASYYREGRLESVLLSVAPGDYVTINMGINSEGENYNKFMEDYYVQGVLERGAIPVILTHTPNGPVGSGYGTFDTSFHVTRDVPTLRNLAAKYSLPIIDVDTHFEEYFNSLLEKDFDTEVFPLRNTENENGKLAGYTAPTTVLGVVQSWYPDHNHYTRELGTPIATYIMSRLNEIVENPFAIESIAQAAEANGGKVTVSLTATIKEDCSPGSAKYDAYVAQYDENGAVISVTKADVTFTSAADGNKASVEYTPDSNAASARIFVWDGMKPLLTNTTINPVA